MVHYAMVDVFQAVMFQSLIPQRLIHDLQISLVEHMIQELDHTLQTYPFQNHVADFVQV